MDISVVSRPRGSLGNCENHPGSTNANKTADKQQVDSCNSIESQDSGLAKENSPFTPKVVQHLLQLAFSVNIDYEPISDHYCDQGYLVKAGEDGKIRLIQQALPLCSEESILYEFEAEDLRQAVTVALQKNLSSDDASGLGNLRINSPVMPFNIGPELLLKLACEIIDSGKLYGCDLVNLARRNWWQESSAGMKAHISNTPDRTRTASFPYEGDVRPYRIESLSTFLKSGQLPETSAEKCLLAWQICIPLAKNSNDDPFHVYAYWQYILKDLKHLDFTQVGGMRWDEFRDGRVFELIVEFVREISGACAISFDGIHASNSPAVLNGLCNLIYDSANLTSLHFRNGSIAHRTSQAEKALLRAIQGSLTLEELSFSGCDFGNSVVKILASGLQENSTLKVLNLDNNQIRLEGALALMAPGISLKSLNLRDNKIDPKDHPKLLEALKLNRHLVFFDIGEWQTPAMQAECEQYLVRNYHRYELYRQVRMLSLSEAMPEHFVLDTLHLIYSMAKRIEHFTYVRDDTERTK